MNELQARRAILKTKVYQAYRRLVRLRTLEGVVQAKDEGPFRDFLEELTPAQRVELLLDFYRAYVRLPDMGMRVLSPQNGNVPEEVTRVHNLLFKSVTLSDATKFFRAPGHGIPGYIELHRKAIDEFRKEQSTRLMARWVAFWNHKLVDKVVSFFLGALFTLGVQFVLRLF